MMPSTMMRFVCLLLLTLMSMPLTAETQHFRVETAYHHSDDRNYSVDQLNSIEFKPYAEKISLGFKSGETWVRIRITPDGMSPLNDHEKASHKLILMVGPHFLDQLDFFERKNGQWTTKSGGDQRDENLKICPIDLHCFELSNDQGGPSTAYLRVNTAGIRVINTEVESLDTVRALSIKRMSNVSISSTISILVLIMALVFLILDANRLMFIYVLFQATVVFATLASSGVISKWNDALTVSNVDMYTNLALVMRVGTTYLLGWAVWMPYTPSQAYDKVVKALFLVCCLNAVLITAFKFEPAYEVNFALMALCPAVHVWGGFGLKKKMPAREALQMAWVLYGVVIFVGSLFAFNVAPWQDNSNTFQYVRDMRLNGVVFGAAVCWLVIFEKNQVKQKTVQEKQQLEIQATQSQMHQESVKERQMLIDMLTHELKTPLSTIKFALSNLKRTPFLQEGSIERMKHIDASVNRMDTMIEHVATTNKIERHNAKANEEMILASELVNQVIQEFRDVDRFALDIADGVHIRADGVLLTLLLHNLVSNAYKYGNQDQIDIRIQQDNLGAVHLDIRNGISPENVPDEAQLFERYYRHPNFEGQSGMGIGLSLVMSAAEKMGATVKFRQEEQTITFEVVFLP
jgi:signal transduction histidine kinase